MADDNDYLRLAKEAFGQSTSYFDTNYRQRMEDAIRMFHSQHPRSSKYNSDAYRYRSRTFRPKSRSVVRKHEATAARAFFSNLDVVSVSPQDGEDEKQIASAIINKELLNYRLTKSIPWFVTLTGAFQDAMKVGMVCSMQYWKFKSRTVEEERIGLDSDGKEVKALIPVDEIYEDKPVCEIIPIENVRFSPNAKWHDVANTSPYLIIQIPMYVYQVKEMSEDGGLGDKWYPVTDGQLRAAQTDTNSTTDAIRRGDKQTPTGGSPAPLNQYDTVWVHLNFMDFAGGKMVYYTLKDQHLLSKPVPMQDMFWHGKMPVVIGFCVLDTHNPFPDGLIDLGKQLQSEANEIANQRLDNVKLVLNKRWLVKRNSNVDTESLLRNVPGGVTMVSNTASDGGDIREVTWQDVTSSSYQEQDRINVDYDDLTGGGINSGSVMTNRKLNETVGGMKIMAQGANDLTEYTIRTFVETWVEPVLRQLMLLEQYYESDETVLAIAGKKAQLWQKFGQDQVTDSLLINELTLSVNVGMGATDPQDRLNKFLMANNSWLQMQQALPPDAQPQEIKSELFGLAGYRDANRFYNGQGDARITALQQQMQQMGQEMQALQLQLANKQGEIQAKVEIAKGNNQTQLLVAQSGGDGLDKDTERMKMIAEQASHERKIMSDAALNREKTEAQMQIERTRLAADIHRMEEEIKLLKAKQEAEIALQERKLAIDASIRSRQADQKQNQQNAATQKKI